jgi:hypothetical protein
VYSIVSETKVSTSEGWYLPVSPDYIVRIMIQVSEFRVFFFTGQESELPKFLGQNPTPQERISLMLCGSFS